MMTMILIAVIIGAIIGIEVGKHLQKALYYRPPLAVAVGGMQILAGLCLLPGGFLRLGLAFCLIFCGFMPLSGALSLYWLRWRQAQRRKARQATV